MMEKNIIGVVSTIVLIFLFIKKVIRGESSKSKLIKEATKNKCFTQATCIDTKFISYRDKNYDDIHMKKESVNAKYKYEVNGQQYYKKLTFTDYGHVNYPNVITVYYKKNNPKKAACKNELTATRLKWFFIIVALTFISALVNQIIGEI